MTGLRRPLLLTLLTQLFAFTAACGYTFEPTVSVDISRLNVDERNRVENLEENLVEYLEQWDDPDGVDFDMVIPLNMQILMENSSPRGTVYHYSATFAISDLAEHQYDDNKWGFDLAEYETIEQSGVYHSFTSLLEFYINILVSHQMDKLDNFGGEPWLEKSVRIAQNARFDQNDHGWYERGQMIESLLSEDQELMRTLTWAYHSALYFYEVVENNYEAWNAAALCVDILEDIPATEKRARFFEFAYFKLGNILKEGEDPEFLNRLKRMDNAHAGYYDRLLDSM